MTVPLSKTAFSIRAGSPSDAAILSDIGRRMFAVAHRDAFAYGEDLESVLDRDWQPHILERELNDPAIRIFVADVDGTPVGLTGLRAGPVPGRSEIAMEICRVYLEQAQFGRGIGAALLDAAIAAADSSGERHTWLVAWERNDRAIPLYERRGFVTTTSFEYKVGRSAPMALLMERNRP